MPRLCFTDNLQRHVACPPSQLPGKTVGEVLTEYFSTNPKARGYILDDRGHLRTHMTIFVNGQAIRDRALLSDPAPEGAEIYVMQALSGG